MDQAMPEQRVAISRVFDAPRERVWEAWTRPELVSRWWGPHGVSVPESSIELDPRVGGTFKLTMVVAEFGMEVPMDSRFVEFAEKELIRFTEPKPCLPQMQSVDGLVTFTDFDGGTELGLDIEMRTSAEIREQSEAGWAESFDRLAAVLAE
ncbi:SRPBCC family protein [Actinokineospora xionganensis]|uniref:SRPBCC domain-containing protein n=1 Tax=Actinokineospora xionganensis TaxID=2684470 RepID=A0ABR7LEB6_9PSEU|nr:SRPBCC domain-containing protein [Actinokineospora xionganensis]MBC6450933.1 SRPBCC domain-containing protein [Actinokineospora xionganensis]